MQPVATAARERCVNLAAAAVLMPADLNRTLGQGERSLAIGRRVFLKHNLLHLSLHPERGNKLFILVTYIKIYLVQLIIFFLNSVKYMKLLIYL
jgi:hypothetical protein